VDHVSITSSETHPLVVTANQVTSRGDRRGRHALPTPELTFRTQTGGSSGAGPGWCRAGVRRDGAPRRAAVRSGGRRADQSSLIGVHLVYQQSLEANLTHQSLDFHRAVRIASRPVKAWDDLVDAEAIQGLRLGESTLDCDRLRLGIDQTQP